MVIIEKLVLTESIGGTPLLVETKVGAFKKISVESARRGSSAEKRGGTTRWSGIKKGIDGGRPDRESGVDEKDLSQKKKKT